MPPLECALSCPGCRTSVTIPLADIAPGRSRACPQCGHLFTFAGQDASQVQHLVDALARMVDVQVQLEVESGRRWWKFW